MDFLLALWGNTILVSAAFGWCSAQIIKTILHAIISKAFNAERLVGAGGMPSSHSATVCALSTSAILVYGVGSPVFAVCAILAFICMYDAMGVRRETGNQAQVINKMIESFQRMSDETMSDEEKLKEFIGHTPLQVLVGAILGIIVALLVCGLRGIAFTY
ncbi:MAG: divergent PAP2 family protein [Lachnospiraceae bacterium]|nr:divergent PAP2 family protein [Lachnospiraceae bacterium]